MRDFETPPWDIIIVDIAPGFVLFFLWAIPFDILMARIFMSDKPPEQQARYKTIIVTDLIIWLLLAVTWGQLFVSMIINR